MSAKKGAPALYELYHSDSSRKGKFGKKKRNLSSSVTGTVGKEIPVKNENINGPAFSSEQVDTSSIDDSPCCLAYEDGRVIVNLPVWLFLMFIAAVVMCTLAAYKLGINSSMTTRQNDSTVAAVDDTASISDNVKQGNTTPPSDEMQAALNSETYPGLITGTVKPGIIKASGESEGQDSVYVRPARCLIVIGHNNPEELAIVRDFFVKNGLALEIAKLSREYVLVTRDGFSSSREPMCQQLKDKIYKVGEKYVTNRPDGGLRITLTTFRSSYEFNTNKLDYNVSF